MVKINRNGLILDNIYEKIKEMLYTSQLVPGQKIVYGDLAKKLNTSITPVIQTLKRLESSKTVEYVPNKGYFVKNITDTEIRELYEAREALEIFLLPNIINNTSPEIIKRITKKFRETDVSDPRTLGIHDAQFHLELAKYGKNEIIYTLLKSIYEQIYLRYKPQYVGTQRPFEALKEHKDILDAISNKDLKEARKVLKKHIQYQIEHASKFYRDTEFKHRI